MAALAWDQIGEKIFETGVDKGVLYSRGVGGAYDVGSAWNGLTAVNTSPSGAEVTKHYANNIVYASIVSAEEFSATIEAFTWPEAFNKHDGVVEIAEGVTVGQQSRLPFGFAWRSLIGNDVDGLDHGYKLNLAYGLTAAPSSKDSTTVSDSPEPAAFSWELSSDPVAVGTIGGVEYKPTSIIVIDSTKADPVALSALEEILYGSAEAEARLPLPSEVYTLMSA